MGNDPAYYDSALEKTNGEALIEPLCNMILILSEVNLKKEKTSDELK